MKKNELIKKGKEAEDLIELKCEILINQLREQREQKAISTYKMEDLTGINQNNITRMEVSASVPNLKSVMRYATALDLTVIPLTKNELDIIMDLRKKNV